MPSDKGKIVSLSEMTDGQEGDMFALMTDKQLLKTKDGKPYWRVGFRDTRREVSFPVWHNSPWAEACRDDWQPGRFYKIRAVFQHTDYGDQLQIRRIREVEPADRDAGFDPAMCRPRSRFDSEAMFAELSELVESQIQEKNLRRLVRRILDENCSVLLQLPAAAHNHHAYAGGFLEHTLSVTKTAVWLADKYIEYYPDLKPPLSRDLVAAGAVLHDIGKLRELEIQPQGAVYSPAGEMIGHILLGRDIVREAAAGEPFDKETLLRLEHIIVSHQGLPEWGSPKLPMTPEALLIHYADDIDAKLNMMVTILGEAADRDEPMTSKKNILGRRLLRGLPAPENDS